MNVRPIAAGLVTGLVFAIAHADEITLTALQTGGFYDGGITPDNFAGFQNYFVGYGSHGAVRTPERRSFFWFDLSSVAGTVTSATMHMKLPFGGLIYGLGPGMPPPPPPPDPFEEFQLGATHFPGSYVTSPGLTAPEIDLIFTSLGSTAIASPHVFLSGSPAPPAIDVGLSSLGIGFLQARLGTEIVLSGWMPTWSEDFRIDPSTGEWLEKHELIFGLTDVHVDPSLMPTLKIVYTPVPEPASLAVLGIGAFALLRRRQRS